MVVPEQTLKHEHYSAQSSHVSSVSIHADSLTITADEILQLEAMLLSATNTTVEGQVEWSCSNGTISSDGIFYPWNAGIILIEAESDGITASINLTVTAGVATSISIATSSASVLETNSLQAQLIDARGNIKAASSQTVWDVNGEYIGMGSPDWIPEDTGFYDVRARLFQLEVTKTVEVIAGSPHSFVFPDYMTVIAGQTYTLNPQLLDINDYSMPMNTAGPLSWWAEQGTIDENGNYSSTNTGMWNLTVTAGNVTGSGVIHVIPGSAVVSQVVFIEELEHYTAGQAYEVAVERRDINGYVGLVTPELSKWEVSSGGLSLDGNAVFWTPSKLGPATISTTDESIQSSIDVHVVHGNAIDVEITSSHLNVNAGDQVVLEIKAVDVKGNSWVVNGTFDFTKGPIDELVIYEDYVLLQAASTSQWEIEATWFDERTNSDFIAHIEFTVSPGRLAFISLQGEGQILPSDQGIDLNPEFFDAYGNELDSIELNWTIDGEDATLQMRLSEGVWASSVVGGHEIRVNADGIFGTVRLNVIPGAAHSLISDMDSGFVVHAGVATDLLVEVIDIHGNVGESSDVFIEMNSTIGEIEASDTGIGYWSFTGKIAGDYSLILREDDASHTIPLTILPGEPIRIRTSMNSNALSQGDIVLIEIWGVDGFDNVVPVDFENTSVKCNAGSATHVNGGTWEIEIDESGNDRYCTILWEGLLAQQFYDVEEVLLGGAVGSTNTAIGMLSFLLGLILLVMIVLVRKASNVPQQDWDEDVFEEEGVQVMYDEEESEESEHPAGPKPTLDEESRKELATLAVTNGVMQAAPGTTQGSTGWYVNTQSGLEAWEVTPDGAWNKLD